MAHLQDAEFNYMLIGLIPLAWVLLSAIRSGVSALVSLISIYVVAIWIQYHLSPWLSLRTGELKIYLLQEQYIADGLLFSNLSMFALILGYGKFLRVSEMAKYNFLHRKAQISEVKTPRLLLFSLIFLFLSVATLIIAVGSFSEVIFNSYSRGYDQFEKLGVIEHLISKFRILSVLFGAFAALLFVYIYQKQRELEQIMFFPLLIVFIFIASSPLVFKFSRMAGGLFLLSGIVFLLLQKGKLLTYGIFAILITIGVYLSQIGITQRGLSNPGIGYFVLSVFSPDNSFLVSNLNLVKDVSIIGPNTNFLDALAPFTARVWASGGWQEPNIGAFLKLLLILQPLPTVFLGEVETFRVGESLSVAFNRGVTTGLTTPALAELYVLFGPWGAAFLFIVGRFLKRTDTDLMVRGKVVALLLYTLCAVAILVAGHNGLRAFARPFVIAVIMSWFFEHMLSKRRSRKPTRRPASPRNHRHKTGGWARRRNAARRLKGEPTSSGTKRLR